MLDFDDGSFQTVFSILSVTTASIVGYLLAKRQNGSSKCSANSAPSNSASEKENAIEPTKWVKVGKISKLLLYPVKSLAGISMEEAVVTPLGLQGRKGSKAFRDRTFLVIDPKRREIDQEKEPKMILIEPIINRDDTITLKAPGREPLTFSLPKDTRENRTSCHLFTSDKNIPCLDCGDEVADFLSDYMCRDGVRLVNHIEGETREARKLTREMIRFPAFKKEDLGVFQNESAYLLIANESILELNKLMSNESTHRNFRPTVLIDDIKEPFGELRWSYVKLGESEAAPVLKTGRPCDRCTIITNDPDTGEMDPSAEYMKTLKTLTLDMGSENANVRMKGRAVMGLRMGLHRQEDVVRVGDPVYTAIL